VVTTVTPVVKRLMASFRFKPRSEGDTGEFK